MAKPLPNNYYIDSTMASDSSNVCYRLWYIDKVVETAWATRSSTSQHRRALRDLAKVARLREKHDVSYAVKEERG